MLLFIAFSINIECGMQLHLISNIYYQVGTVAFVIYIYIINFLFSFKSIIFFIFCNHFGVDTSNYISHYAYPFINGCELEKSTQHHKTSHYRIIAMWRIFFSFLPKTRNERLAKHMLLKEKYASRIVCLNYSDVSYRWCRV